MYSGTKKLILDYLMDETAYLKRKTGIIILPHILQISS